MSGHVKALPTPRRAEAFAASCGAALELEASMMTTGVCVWRAS